MTDRGQKNRTDSVGIDSIDHLIEMFPDSPHFLGKNIYYPKTRKNGFLRKRGFPDLNPLREQVHKFSTREQPDHTRHEIVKYLKQFPNSPDLNALKAIQIYNDANQGGATQDKLDLMAEALTRIAKSLHNGGIHYFNVTWFATIYLKYIDLIKERISREYSAGVQHADHQVRLSAEKLYQKLLKIPRLTDIYHNLSTLTTLGIKLKGSAFVTEPVTRMEIIRACEAISKRKEKKTIAPGKTAANIIFITLTFNILFSKIPLLRNLLNDQLKNIPDSSRDLILQKQLVINTSRAADFQLAIAGGNPKLAKDLANTIYQNSLRVINDYLETALLKKMFEVDPYIKTAWIVSQSTSLFEKADARQRLEKALSLLKIVNGDRCQYRGAVSASFKLKTKIETLLSELD
jgi:hypothetical protein